MDLFEAFPQLQYVRMPAFAGRSLRLISVAGVVYDQDAFYFEFSAQSLWGRLPDGRVSVGVGSAKAPPVPGRAPHQALTVHLRDRWGCEVALAPLGHTYMLLEDQTLAVVPDMDAHIPFFLIFTPPRLGGAEVPDALVQAVYLLPVRAWASERRSTALLQVGREALAAFLDREDWLADELRHQPWARFLGKLHLPNQARVRPVLALRGLQRLIAQDLLLPALFSLSSSGAEPL